MAPNKKKKKPATNPARGFATVSVASKPKPDDRADAAAESVSKPDAALKTNEPQHIPQEAPKEINGHNGDMQTMSPADLEQHLEQSDLQSTIEKYGQSTKRTSARQAAKLQTERRLLRPQAIPLETSSWLPSELMDLILEYTGVEMKSGILRSESDTEVYNIPRQMNQEDITVKLWTLEQTLRHLGCAESDANHILQRLTTDNIMSQVNPATGNKDALWCLDESLDILALKANLTDLQDYDKESKSSVSDQRPAEPTPPQSGANTPKPNVHEITHSRPSTPKEASNNNLRTSEASSPQVSDSESDIDPDSMISKYLDIKAQLFRIQPDIVDPRLGKRGKDRKTKSLNQEAPLSSKVSRLQQKLSRIERDVLFDQDEADRQWVATQASLARDIAERRRLNLGNHQTDTSPSRPQRPTTAHAPATRNQQDQTNQSEDSENDDILGDMFTNLPEAGIDGTSMVQTNGEANVTIRNFGKWSGMSPRRVLEEACKARSVTRVHDLLLS